MAYSDPGDLASGAVITEAWVVAVRASLLASGVAIVTTAGDIVAATAATTLARLEVGEDDSTLVADSGQATGLAWQIQPAARVYNDAEIDPATSSWVSLTFNQERYDTDGVHSTVTNSERLTCPDNGSGLYHIGGCLQIGTTGGTGANIIGVRLFLNGTTSIAESLEYRNVSAAINLIVPISCDYALSDNGAGANDYVELQVFTSVDVNVLVNGNTSPEFWCHWFRRA